MRQQKKKPYIGLYPLVNKQKAIENGHRSSGIAHWKWWFSIIVMLPEGKLYDSSFPIKVLTFFWCPLGSTICSSPIKPPGVRLRRCFHCVTSSQWSEGIERCSPPAAARGLMDVDECWWLHRKKTTSTWPASTASTQLKLKFPADGDYLRGGQWQGIPVMLVYVTPLIYPP